MKKMGIVCHGCIKPDNTDGLLDTAKRTLIDGIEYFRYDQSFTLGDQTQTVTIDVGENGAYFGLNAWLVHNTVVLIPIIQKIAYLICMINS